MVLFEYLVFGFGLFLCMSEGFFFEGMVLKEISVRLELFIVGGIIDVVGRFGKFVVFFG